MKLYSLAFLFVFILRISFSSNDSVNWVLKKRENGINVYTRYSENSKIKAVRIIDTVSSSFSGIVALLLDTKNYPSWVYRCSECKTLKLINQQEQYNYELTDVPWPFDDRDVITDTKVSQDPLTKIVRINSISAPYLVPERHGVVRIIQFTSVYKLIKLPNGRVVVDYELFADPCGDIPAWLINANIIVGPYNSTTEMVKRLPQYQSATYSFINEK